MEVSEFLSAQGGFAKTAATRLACGRRRLERAIHSGSVRRFGANVVYLPEADPAAVYALGYGGRIGCVSLLEKFRVQLLRRPEKLHICVAKNNSRSCDKSVVLHRENPWGEDPASVILAATLRALQCVETHAERVVILDSVLNQGLVDYDYLLRQSRRVRRRKVTQAVADCDSGARSALETIARLELRSHGFRVETGVVIPGVGEVDLLVNGGLIVELDGYAYHCSPEQFEKDRQRSREASYRGFPTLRFTYQCVMQPGFVANEVARFFAGCTYFHTIAPSSPR